MPIQNITYLVIDCTGNPPKIITSFRTMPLAEADARDRARRFPGRDYAAAAITKVFGAPQEVVERELQAPNDMGIGEDPENAQRLPNGLEDVVDRLGNPRDAAVQLRWNDALRNI